MLLHHAVLYHTMPYYTILFHTIPYNTTLYCTILYYTALYLTHSPLNGAPQGCGLPAAAATTIPYSRTCRAEHAHTPYESMHCTALHCVALHCMILYHTTLYSTTGCTCSKITPPYRAVPTIRTISLPYRIVPRGARVVRGACATYWPPPPLCHGGPPKVLCDRAHTRLGSLQGRGADIR